MRKLTEKNINLLLEIFTPENKTLPILCPDSTGIVLKCDCNIECRDCWRKALDSLRIAEDSE